MGSKEVPLGSVVLHQKTSLNKDVLYFPLSC